MLSVQLVQLGRLAYSPALGVQHKFVQKLHEFRQSTQEADTPQGFLLAVEHEPVYTVGLRDRRGYRDQQDRLRSLGAEMLETFLKSYFIEITLSLFGTRLNLAVGDTIEIIFIEK